MAQFSNNGKFRGPRKGPKISCQNILASKFTNYEDALTKVNLELLKDKRTELCKKFAKKCTKSDNIRAKEIFQERRVGWII